MEINLGGFKEFLVGEKPKQQHIWELQPGQKHMLGIERTVLAVSPVTIDKMSQKPANPFIILVQTSVVEQADIKDNRGIMKDTQGNVTSRDYSKSRPSGYIYYPVHGNPSVNAIPFDNKSLSAEDLLNSLSKIPQERYTPDMINMAINTARSNSYPLNGRTTTYQPI